MTLLAIILLPLGASLVQLFFGKRLPRQGDFVTIGAMAVAWVLALSLFVPPFFLGAPLPDQAKAVDWAVTADGAWRLGIFSDGLTLGMLFVVTTVSLLVHVFSAGYMHGHPRYSRFFAFISFFTFAMLGLVGADNLLFLFICWELMGFCSYMLIGFYFENPTAYRAAIKAFLTTRVGDVGLLIGIATLFAATGSLTFSGIQAAIVAGHVSGPLLLLAALCILSGAIGKSAQFPLHVWLPDAMEGPSPVSALIHAATMVAAGVYLVGRSIAFGFFPPEALFATALVGSFTAFFSATMALAAMDFKKVLAYSTISQLGFMLCALAVGGWTAGFFHLTTHAFFKALLFLGSGAVLHALHTRDMREMGGLKTKLPITYWTMIIGALALAGFPGLSGFFSKDEILAAALGWGLEHGRFHFLPFAFLITAAAMTAFYTFRMMILVFHGTPRDQHKYDHAHEGPPSITGPLVVLAVLAISAGWGWLRHPFEALVIMPPAGEGHAGGHGPAGTIAMVASVVVGLGGIALAFAVYHFRWLDAAVFTRGPLRRAIHTMLVRLYWIDDLYLGLVRAVVWFSKQLGIFDRRAIDRLVDAWGPGLVGTANLTGKVDARGVDGVINGVADLTQESGNLLRRLQTGRVQDYAFGLMVAVLLLIVWVKL